MDMWKMLWLLLLISLATGDECMDQLGLYMSYFSTFPNMPLWALVMFDSSTKIPEGLLAGKFVNFGNFDECINIRGVQTSFGNFDGKHCLVTVVPELPFLPRNTTAILKNEAIWPTLISEDKTTAGFTSIMLVSVCVPSSCSAIHVQQFLPEVWQRLIGINVTALATDTDCHTAENPLHTSDWLVVMFFVIFATIVAVSTAYDIFERDKGKRRNLLLSFSVYSNGKRLFSTSTSKDSLGSLHGIRFITISWVVLGHYYPLAMINMSNVNYFVEDTLYSWTRLYLTNATLSVDTFFLLSGLLVSYVFLRTVKSLNKFNLIIFYIHRYIRLTPSVAIVVLLIATVMKYVSTGPLWDSANAAGADLCIRNWWSTLLYVNNYVHPLEICVPVSWYLSVDMQLYWLSPLLLIPLWKKPRIGVWFGVILAVTGMIISFIITYVNELGSNVTFLQGEAANEYFKKYYIVTHCRFTPYVIGILLGHYLYKLKSENQSIGLTKIKVIVGWLCIAALLLAPLTSVHPMDQLTYKYNAVDASFYNALARPAWSLGVALLILFCNFGYGGIVNAFLSWNFFLPLSKLSYGIFLTHGFVQQIQMRSVRTTMFGGEVFLIPGYLGNLLFSVFAALILYLWFESPFMVIERELLGKKKSSSKGFSKQQLSENMRAQEINVQCVEQKETCSNQPNATEISIGETKDKKSM